MRTMTKSAIGVAKEALAVGKQALPPYSSRFSRHDHTQPQLFALLVLKQFLRTDYRGLVTLLAEWGEMRRALGLKKVPHYSTLCYAEQRLLTGAEKGGPFSKLSRPSSPAPPAKESSLLLRLQRWMRQDSRPATSASTTESAAARRSASTDVDVLGRSSLRS